MRYKDVTTARVLLILREYPHSSERQIEKKLGEFNIPGLKTRLNYYTGCGLAVFNGKNYRLGGFGKYFLNHADRYLVPRNLEEVEEELFQNILQRICKGEF